MSVWRNGELTAKTAKGEFNITLGLNSTASRNRLGFSRVNPETGNKIKQKYVDEKTGEEFNYGSWGKAYTIDEDNQVIFEKKETIDKLKESALSTGMNIQKLVDKKELDIAMVKKKGYHLTPKDEAQSMKYSLIHHGLQETGKIILLKYAPSSSENLYALWSDERGLWLSQMTYPEAFKQSEVELPELSDNLKDKAVKLVEKLDEDNQKDEIVNNQREKLEEAIEKKMSGQELDVAHEVEEAEEQDLEQELATLI